VDIREIEQERASFAFKVVSDIKDKYSQNKKVQGKYSSYAEKAPTIILNNGLGATLAFFLSKLEKPIDDVDYKSINPESFGNAENIAYAFLYKHLSTWLAEGNGKDSAFSGLTNGEDPLKYIMEKTAIDVAISTEEALSILNWIKKFAKAMLEEEL